MKSLITISKIVFLSSAVLIALSTMNTALAKDYKVEVLIFENLDANIAYEPNQYDKPSELESEALTWKIPPSMLMEQASALKNSSSYRLLHYLSWGQESLPQSESAVRDVLFTDLTGWIKVYANQLLFANIDLDFDGYRLTEKRRLKLDERHFFDHPKYGVLMQVSRLEAEEPQTTEKN